MEKKIFLAVCLAAVLLSAGCNSPSGQKDNTVNEQVNTGDKPATTKDSGTGNKPSGGVLDDITGLFTSRPREYMVEYKDTVTLKDQGETSGTMAFYYRGTDQIRTDTSMGGIDSRYYMNKDDFVMCNRQGGEWSCMQIQKGQQSQTEDVNKDMDELKKNVETNPVTRLPDRVIAGVNCKCFNVKVTVNVPSAKETGLSEFESTSCVSPEGIPLYTETRSESMTSIMEATKYSTHVSDADFIPPAEPVDMMEAMTGGSKGQGADEQPIPPAEEVEDAGVSSEDIKQAQCDACENMPTEDAKEQCMKMFKC